MKKPINEIAKYKRLAGLITESEYQEEVMKSEAKSSVSKEDKIQVIKEWIWFTCDEGQAKDDINKYNKMVDMYFASKDDVTKEDFKNIWNKVIEKWGVGDVGADSEGFYDVWKDIQTGTLVNPGQTYEGKEKEEEGYMGTQYDSSEDMAVDMLKKGITEATPLKLKGYYQVLDAGTDEWNDDYQYMGEVGYGSSAGEVGEHMFVAPDAPGSFVFVSIPDADLDTMVKPSMSEGKEKEEEQFGGINEALEPHVYERMYNLSNIKAQQAMIRAAEILMNDLTEEGFEVPEIREFFTQLIANDI